MALLIDKEAVLAEIEELSSAIKIQLDYKKGDSFWIAQKLLLERLEGKINYLQVKEVDLEKELEDFLEKNSDSNGFFNPLDVAKHFFELGMCVNNPITAADRGTAEEIIVNLKRVEQDYRINLTKEIEWVRNQVKKGE